MGTWGAGSFENDDAMDFVYAFEEDGVDALCDALITVDDADYVEAGHGVVAIAASDIIAAAVGLPIVALPPAVAEALDVHGEAIRNDSAALKKSAIGALKKILSTDSELKELWAESGESSWLASVTDLVRRLEA